MPRKAKPKLNNSHFEFFTIAQITKLAMTFWVGGTLTIGFVVVPLLFKSLDEITAAVLAGQLFNINAYIGIVALLLALINLVVSEKFRVAKLRKFWYVLIMTAILIINYFAIFPIIVRLRSTLIDVANRVIIHSTSFNFWHSLSAILFLIISILGVLYILEK